MFGKKDNASIRINTMLGTGSEFAGGFTAEGSARVDGIVNGDVKITGTLILGSTGKINGNVTADSVIIGGEIVGNVMAPTKADLTATAKVLGDVTTKVIIIDENAVFQGNCFMYQELPGKTEEQTIPKLVKPSDRPNKRTAKEALQDALREVKEEENRESKEESAQTAQEVS